MLQSPNGSKLHRHSLSVPILDSSSVGEARRVAANLCEDLVLSDVQRGRVAIVINELGSNLMKYARKGRIVLTTTGFVPDGIDIIALDEGPGLDIGAALLDGFTTSSSPGTGLGAIQRQSDAFDIYSQPIKGTIIYSHISRDPVGRPHYDIAAIGLPLPGETVSGDGWLVAEKKDGLAILMVDGLGHGKNANQATVEATEVFQSAYDEPIDRQLHLIHGRLKSTRGAAVFLLDVGASTLDFAGVGNIRAIWQNHGKTRTLLSHNGTAGVQMRKTQTISESWDQTGYLVLHSDGVLGRFNLADYPGLLQKRSAVIAGVLMRDFWRGTDDASILVVRALH